MFNTFHMVDTQNLSLQQRVERMQNCAKKINALCTEFHFMGIGNIPLTLDEPVDTYDKDAKQGLDILCALYDAEDIAKARADELANQLKEAI